MGYDKKRFGMRLGRVFLLGVGPGAMWSAVWLERNLAVPPVVSVTLAGLGIITAWIGYRWFLGGRLRALQLSNIDEMSGTAFEAYVSAVLSSRGYTVTATAATGDLGVDLIAELDGEATAIQVKRSARPVSRRAVSDAVAGMSHYGCSSAMVITNSLFTTGAATLAGSTACLLVDRDNLANWILEFQRKKRRQALSSAISSSGMSKLE